MFYAKYFCSSSCGFLKEDILSFFILVAMATRVLLGIKVFEQFKVDYQRNIPVKFG
jgi:hypothetical protein